MHRASAVILTVTLSALVAGGAGCRKPAEAPATPLPPASVADNAPVAVIDGRSVAVVAPPRVDDLPCPAAVHDVETPPVETPAEPETPVAVPVARPLRRVKRVVIDPGHGGGDTGAVGRRGIMEKDVNLAVARELKQYLERSGELDVVLTRQRDEAMDLDARAEAANAAGGDLFISLHCNSWFDDQARGFETYFLSPASSDWARSVEAAENGASDGGREPGDVEFIVWELVQNRYITRSSQFAEYLQARACRELGSPDRGVRQAGFRVLVGAYMPAVLVELGFLSHADEEMRLDERTYQRQLARTIGDAVLGFARTAATVGAGTEASR